MTNIEDKAKTFEFFYNSETMKEKTGLSWAGYRKQLKKEYPNEWKLFRASIMGK